MTTTRARTTSAGASADDNTSRLPAAVAIRRARRQQFRWTAEATALILAVVFSAIYLSTRTAYYSVDAIRIAAGINAFHRTHDLNALFHPGYLAYGPIGIVAWHVAQRLGYHGGPLAVLEAVNSVCGGIGLGLLSLLLRAVLTRSRAMTVLLPIALGFSFGYWLAATDARAEMPALACSIGALYLLVRAMLLPTAARSLCAGLAVSAACVLHIFSALLIVPGVIGLLLGDYTQGTRAEEYRARLTNIALFVAASVLPAALVYLIVGDTILKLPGSAGWRAWVSQGFVTDWWFSPHFWSNLRLDLYAFRKALFVEPGQKTGTFHLGAGGSGMVSLGLYWLALVAWFVAVYAILSATAYLMRTHYRAFLTVTLALALVYAVVFTYVSPGYFVFWTPVTIGSAITTAISGSYYRGRRGGTLWLVGIGCWTAIFAASNYAQFIGSHRDVATNPWMQDTNYIAERMTPGDVLVVSGFGDDTAIVAYVPYFTNCNIFSLHDSLQRHAGSARMVKLTALDLQGAVAQAVTTGHRAYAYGDIWQDPAIRERLKSDYGVYNPQELFVGFRRAPAWHVPDQPDAIVWKLIPATAPPVPARLPSAVRR